MTMLQYPPLVISHLFRFLFEAQLPLFQNKYIHVGFQQIVECRKDKVINRACHQAAPTSIISVTAL